KTFNDPVHGHFRLDSVCTAVIDTEQFQRLRNLSQLGTDYYVYPGASHRRFEHSLGVCHLASMFVEHLRRIQPELGIDESDIKCVRLAALCHDLGHGPFSHVFDNEFIPRARKDIKWTHEQGSQDMLEFLVEANPDVKELITDQELRFIKDLILGDKDTAHGYPQATEKKYLFDIVANKTSGLDVDKFDYIARDCHNVGTKSGCTTPNRLIHSSRVIGQDICYNVKEVFNMSEVFYSRYSLFKRVYTHKVSKAMEYMLTDIFLLADPYMKISSSIDDAARFMHMTDDILGEIARSTVKDLADARALLTRMRTRDLYRVADIVVFPFPKKSVPSEYTTYITPANIAEAFQGPLESESRPEESDIIVEWLPMNYSMKDRNPVDQVRFFGKWDLKTSFAVPKHEVSGLIAPNFEETVLRVYSRLNSKRQAVQTAF
ncbi:hypothetical protein BDK51DRAFT_14666, partial [Blyttiomyces helicus]